MYFHRTVRDRTATVWRRCDVVVDHWRCRPDVEGGVRLLGQICIKKEPTFFLYLADKFVEQTVR